METQTQAQGADLMARSQGSVCIAGITLDYTIDGSGIPLLVVGSSVYYPRTFSENLRQSCAIVCADLPHFVEPGPEFRLQANSIQGASKRFVLMLALVGWLPSDTHITGMSLWNIRGGTLKKFPMLF